MIATGAQIRAGRALLGWRQRDLAEAAGLHSKAVAYWERKTAMRTQREEVGVGRIRRAFKAAGVVTFTSPSPGVRLVSQGQFSDTNARAWRAWRAGVMGC